MDHGSEMFGLVIELDCQTESSEHYSHLNQFRL